ncbi:MAG TPA: substrate-binding domain-containing protein, partial [Ktedonobacteraceae bacterium]|nr:substrate-binding domain-containing protein [Ktedonobacteraceae bacterium]
EPIPSPRALCPDMPETVEMVVRVALAKTPQARFPDAESLSRALLAALVKDEPPPVVAATHTITPRRRVQGRRGYAGQPPSVWSRVVTLTSVFVVLAGLIGVMLFFAAVPFRLQDLRFLPFHFPPAGPGGLSLSPVTTSTPVVPPLLPGQVGPSSGGTTSNFPGTATPEPGVSPTMGATAMPTAIPTLTATSTPIPLVCANGTLSIDGSPYLAPILALINQDYASGCSGMTLTMRNDGIRALNFVQNGRVDVADTDVTANASRNLVDHPIAALLYSLIVSPDVALSGVNNLSLADIQDIYAGQITNWSQLGGPDERIIVVYPPPNASINAIFRAFVLGGVPPQAKGYTLKRDNPNVTAQLVAQTPGAISYVPLETLSTAHAQPLSINGFSASSQTLLSGDYPFWSVEHVYTLGFGTTQAQDWLQFLPQESNTMLVSGAVPVSMLSPGILLSHLPGPQF